LQEPASCTAFLQSDNRGITYKFCFDETTSKSCIQLTVTKNKWLNSAIENMQQNVSILQRPKNFLKCSKPNLPINVPEKADHKNIKEMHL
jgi:hypothetical protein